MSKSYKIEKLNDFMINHFDPSFTNGMDQEECLKKLTENTEKINQIQKKLFAEKKEGVIFVFQAMDAAGKDGTIKAVFTCLPTHGVKESAFKTPSSTELNHDFLWRIHQEVPERGNIAIFNRSHYEDVLIGKVHNLYHKLSLADRIDRDKIIKKRYQAICNFEEYLYDNSIRTVKLFLNLSKKEQALRFISRIEEQRKNWKFNPSDVKERAYWNDYQKAFEEVINETATDHCPWYIIPADHKWYMRYLVSEIVLKTLEEINPKYPDVDKGMLTSFEDYRKNLLSEIKD